MMLLALVSIRFKLCAEKHVAENFIGNMTYADPPVMNLLRLYTLGWFAVQYAR